VSEAAVARLRTEQEGSGVNSATSTDFVHLRTHSHYSLLSATCRTKELVAAAHADGQRALALTDSGNLFGAVEFYKACQSKELKPILGMATYIAGRSRLEPTTAENPTYDLSIWAADTVGFANLRRLSSAAYLEGFHYRPRIDRELLARHREGLIVASGNGAGEMALRLQQGDVAGAARLAG
jgi:DNA polymerase-3 subunit alpha